MSEFFIVVIGIFMLFAGGLITGANVERDQRQEKCVAKYSDMPNNKVHDYCKELLKFNKE